MVKCYSTLSPPLVDLDNLAKNVLIASLQGLLTRNEKEKGRKRYIHIIKIIFSHFYLGDV